MVGGRSTGRAGWAAVLGVERRSAPGRRGRAAARGVGDAAVQAERALDRDGRPDGRVAPRDDELVRRLMAQGTSFENSFVGFALCCPSRATTLTGQYAHNHGVLGNAPPEGGYAKLDGTNTLPVWLQRAGYFTAHIGKYLERPRTRNPNEVPPGARSEWHGSVDPSTYRFYDYTPNEDGTLRHVRVRSARTRPTCTPRRLST